MTAIGYRPLVSHALPDNLPRLSIKTNDFESMLTVGAHGIRMNEVSAVQELMRDSRFCSGNHIAIQRSRQKDLIAPNDRRRVTTARYRGLPLDVFSGAPFDR